MTVIEMLTAELSVQTDGVAVNWNNTSRKQCDSMFGEPKLGHDSQTRD